MTVWKDDEGAAPIEFALAVGFLLIPMVVLVMSVAPWVERQSMARVAAGEAARILVLSSGSTPDEVAASKEVFLAFDEALRQLPVEQRSAFVLAEVEGVTYERIAEIEGAPLGTVKSRIARAREKLRQTLQVVVSDSDHD